MTTLAPSRTHPDPEIDRAVEAARAATLEFLRETPDAALSDVLAALIPVHAVEPLSLAIANLLARHEVRLTSGRHLVLAD